jgi:predicted nucleotidyltransferase
MSTNFEAIGLLECLFGKARRSILALLYHRPDESFHLRKVLRLARVSPGAGQRELARLTAAGIITRAAVDNQVRFRANPRCPVFAELKGLVEKTAGVAETLRTALAPVTGSVERAVVYGFTARGRVGRESDVELLIVGEVSYADLAGPIAGAGEALGREINATVLSGSEFRGRLAGGDEFIRGILDGPLIPVLPES